jgi:arylsulfatase A-like enzyme
MSVRPNILLVMTDQQRGDCLSLARHPALLTPTMDALGAQGAWFRRAYVTCPSCVAARRSLLSGQFPATHGLVGYADGIEWPAPPTLPGVLAEHGYQTAIVGRSMHQHPPRKRYGYQQMTLSGTGMDYEEYLAQHAPPGSGGYYGTGVMHNDWTARPWPLADHLHHTHWTVNQALDFLHKRDPSCPFFLTVSFIAPHPPLIPPACYFERYLRTPLPEPVYGDWATPPADDGLGQGQSPSRVHLTGEALRSARAAYYGLINHIDDELHRLLNPVTGQERLFGGPTIVLFTSDHGEMLGDHYCWRKSVPYEGAAHIPFLLRTPPQLGLRSRLRIDAPVCLEDVMPTLLDLAGVPIPATVQGRSLVPWLRGETPAWRDWLHLEHAPLHQTLTDGREKYIWHVADGREQFFRLTSDPHERHDLAAAPAEAATLAQWRSRLIAELAGRPEGFTDGQRLLPGRPYHAALPHAGPRPTA